MIQSNRVNLNQAYNVLAANNLHKSYGSRKALKGLSFTLEAGRILGFLGPNGAGKTTAIRILTTILSPDAGEFVVDGTSSRYPEIIRSKIGVLPESLGFPKHMTGLECLTFFGQLYGRSAKEARMIGKLLLKEVGLEKRARSLIGTYSRGMRQRLGIARAIINEPVVVFLDEPTLGLDPRGQQELLNLVTWVAKERNVGVILCSHLLSEVESVCDDVIILSVGQIVASGTVSEVIGQAQSNSDKILLGKALRIQVEPDKLVQARTILNDLPQVSDASTIPDGPGFLLIKLSDSGDGKYTRDLIVNNHILGALVEAEVPILRFETRVNRLQDVFLQLTEEIIS